MVTGYGLLIDKDSVLFKDPCYDFKITKLFMMYKLCINYVLTFASQPASYVKIHMCGFSDVVTLAC